MKNKIFKLNKYINIYIRRIFSLVMLVAFVFVLPVVSFAVSDVPIAGSKISNPIKGVDSLDGLLKILLEGLIKIGIPIVALAVIYSGFLFVSAQGNSEKLKSAKRALSYSLIGAAILLGSWAIAQLISSTVTALGS